MSTTGTRAGTDSTKAEGRTPRRQARPDDPPEHHPLGMRVADPQALQAVISLARQQLERNISDTHKEILKPPAAEIQLSRMFVTENQIGHLIAASVMEAEREHRQRFAEIANSCHELVEGLRMQTSKIARVAEDSTASLRPMAEVTASLLPSLEIGLGLDAISALGDLHGPVRIHAVPRLPSQRVALSGRCRDHLSYKALFPSPPEAPEQAAGWLDDSLDDELQVQLSRFQRSEEIPSDVREGLSKFLAWWNLNQSQITSDQSLELNLNLQAFLPALLGLSTAPDGHQQLSSGLLVPRSHSPVPTPDLATEVYTTNQLATKVHLSPASLQRLARYASERGPLPQQLQRVSGCFVVGMSDPKGGKGCGWKFQVERKPEDI